MQSSTKTAVRLAGIVAASLVFGAAAHAGCHTWVGVADARDEHAARQGAILEANTKFNSTKTKELAAYGTADALNSALDKGSMTMDVECRGAYECKATKTWCSK